MQLSARRIRDPRGLFVRVAGDLDLATAPALEAVLATATRLLSGPTGYSAPAYKGGSGLRVDLSGLRSADWAGLAPVRAAQARLLTDGSRLGLTAVPPRVLRLLTTTHDRQILDVATSLDSQAPAAPRQPARPR